MNTNTKHTLRLLQDRNCLSADELHGYQEGTLSAQETQTIESHLLDCPLCSDAVDGLIQQKVRVPLAELHAARLQGGSSGNVRFWLAAASLLFAAALGSWLFYTFQEKPVAEKLALQNENTSKSSPVEEVDPVPSSDAQVLTEEYASDQPRSSTKQVQLAQSDKAKENSPTGRVAKDEQSSTNEDTQTFSSDIAMAEMPAVTAEEKTTVAAVAKSQAAPAASRSAARAEVLDAELEPAQEDLSIQAMFAREQYRAILEKFKFDKSQETLLFKGKSLYKLNRYKEALQTLQQVNEAPWRNESDWVSANCLMELGKTDRAKLIFDKLSITEGPHQLEAKAMSDKLK